MRILGHKEGKRGESVLENIVYRVNNNFYRVNIKPLDISSRLTPGIIPIGFSLVVVFWVSVFLLLFFGSVLVFLG